jgi:ATP-dependent DNA ligase
LWRLHYPALNGYLAAMLPRRIRTDGFADPCIPSLAHKPPAGPDWVHEIKHDGYRLIVRRDGATVRLFARRGYDWTDRYPANQWRRSRRGFTAAWPYAVGEA